MTSIPDYHYYRAMARHFALVLLDPRGDILFASPCATQYVTGGTVTGQPLVPGISDPALQAEVGAILGRTRQTGQVAQSHPVQIGSGGTVKQVRAST